ncbi:hypothetical protein H8S95_13450 [Pontibacter sp. KCTC 32443]|uniref:hypothetical protein n=1 Tax=Pontibacter TaxID=323449 RepID=UPI00164DAAB7|nr:MULTISPECIES: hypothetical protein [Pontibacter]MBC5775077.1 hypothetical protein [Pontibacter sp. KCTC 32443]
MKITFQIAVAALFVGLMSCSDSGKTETKTTTAPAANAPATVAPNQATTPATTVGLNPPHGEPGHRCDIKVGAPLNSPAQPNLSVPQPTFTPSTTQPQTVAPGTNPPHGQPGHDCGIPVGAPLTKK